MSGRPRAPRSYARAVAGLGVVALGVVAAGRLEVRALPPLSYPGISASIQLAEATDVEDLTLRYLPAFESAVRELGDVRGLRGSVSPSRAQFEIGFLPGTDPVRKAGRLSGLLAPLRRVLPEGSSVRVYQESEALQGAMSVALVGESAEAEARGVAQELEALAVVREVEIVGAATEEIRVELPAASSLTAADVQREVRRHFRPAPLGAISRGGRELPVTTASSGGGDISGLAVRVGGRLRTLREVAAFRSHRARADERSRVDGAPAVLMEVRRSAAASPLALDASVRALARRLEVERPDTRLVVLESEGAPVRRMLEASWRALLAALVVLSAGGLLLGGARAGLTLAGGVAVGAAAVCNAAWLGGLDLDLVTAPALLLGLLGSLALLAARTLGGASSATAWSAAGASALVPVAVALGTGPLAAFLATPARAYALASAAASAATWLLPPAGAPLAAPAVRRQVRRLLRDPLSVVLLAIAGPYVSLVYFGPHLIPVPGTLSGRGADVSVSLGLPDGTSMATSEALARAAEGRLAELSGIERIVTQFGSAGVTLALRLAPAELPAERRERIARRAEWWLRGRVSSMEVSAGGAGAGGSIDLSGDMEERPSAPDDGSSYRLILRSQDPRALQRGAEALKARLPAFQPEWQPGVRRTLLVPRPSTSPAEASAIAAAIEERTEMPRATLLPGPLRRHLVVLEPHRPRTERDLPQLRRLLHEPLLVGANVALLGAELAEREERLLPAMTRISGRFVLPCVTMFESQTLEGKLEQRAKVHRTLELVRLPDGVDMERPDVTGWATRLERLRLLALPLLFPALLATLAAFVANSLPRALLVLLPLFAGLGAVAPLLAWTGASVDELALLALAAGLSWIAAPVVDLAGDGRLRGSYEPALRRAHAYALAAIAVLAGALAAWLVPGAERDPWRLPAVAGAVTGAAALASAPLLFSASLLAARPLAREARQRRTARRRPDAWQTGPRPEGRTLALEARSLTKRYAAGVWALRDVSFTLGPGIVGLLGPNGAGKTTLLRILVGLLQPTRGMVVCGGVGVGTDNLAGFRRLVGFLPQEFNAYPGFTAEQFLDYWALEKGIAGRAARDAAIAEVLALVGLQEDARRRVRDFSGGMRQRIGIAQALLGAPPILIVDEPTTGLDIAARQRFREVLLRVAKERIVILSTHLAGDVEATAARILLVHRGRLRVDGSPASLVDRARGQVFESILPDREIRAFGRRHRVTARVRVLEGIRIRAVVTGDEPPPGREVEPTLEEAYLAEIDRIDRSLGVVRKETLSFLG